ncbi:AAA family ATPase [Rhabdaerophilum sp. SD176]|uniref:AAA family ATPase n=1 Tax=Rhabdaerophilum sp. SD176 TaxID=2983548 RepID=UPI0024DFA0E0|nr:AAA family ATPase [Rhabdaerophilum sp. SD176]
MKMTSTDRSGLDRNPFDDPLELEPDFLAASVEIQPSDHGSSSFPKQENPPQWRVFTPAEAAALLDEAETEADFGKGAFRADWIRRMAEDPRDGQRDLLRPHQAQIDAVDALSSSAPHFQQFFDIVRPALGAALRTGRPFSLQPILLVGEPGVGKTHVAREFARAIGLPFQSYSMPNQLGAGLLTGRDMSWKTPAIGIVAKTLIAGGVASPVFLLDEIDKTPGRGSEYGDPLGPLHDLLEPSSAQRVEDDCLKLHFDARHVIWMATANDLGSLPPSLLDRFLILEVQRPSQSQMQIVLEHLYREVILDWGDWFEPSLSPEAREGLRAAHPRKARRILAQALIIAAHHNRHKLDRVDIAQAAEIFEQSPASSRMGFV